MSGLELNKIVASILLAGLMAMVTGFIADILYKPDLDPKQRGYIVEIAEGEGAAKAGQTEEEQVNIAELMSQASAEKGKKVAKKCISCHSFNKGGANKVGPNLWGIIGNKTAHAAGFAYSKALAGKDGKWTYDNLFHFLHNPRKYLPGTKMSFIGLKKEADIADLLQYLRLEVSDTPPALPENTKAEE